LSEGVQEGGCVMERRTDPIPAPVPATRRATPAGDVQARWDWTEPTVWTPRMRTALDRGVKGATCFTEHWVVLRTCSPSFRPSVLFEVRPPTGEPCAGEPHARFGGRGGQATGLPYPYRTSLYLVWSPAFRRVGCSYRTFSWLKLTASRPLAVRMSGAFSVDASLLLHRNLGMCGIIL